MTQAALSEFDLIDRYFKRPVAQEGTHAWIRQGIGDDCALIAPEGSGHDWAVTSDMLVEGTHFFSDVHPEHLGAKALAVNLSDLAAAGAEPKCFFLALALPASDTDWLSAFSKGLFQVADAFGCALLGGDTTRAPRVRGAAGPITISITAMGTVPKGLALSRASAVVGDDIWVSGTLGAAALALAARQGQTTLTAEDAAHCQHRLDRPQPRVHLGLALRGMAHAAIDVSDGLMADLGHVCTRSNLGATIDWAAVPLTPALKKQSLMLAQSCALSGGDDYELLFTAPESARDRVRAAAQQSGTAVTRIGVMTQSLARRVLDGAGQPITLARSGFDHFAKHLDEPHVQSHA